MQDSAARPVEALDVVIVGAGLSGICAAWHLQDKHPGRSYTILEMREAIGGTWDLFRYPGVRSDSDMPTLGYRFRPWTGEKAIADGPAILQYVRDTAEEAGIARKIRFRQKVVAADWSTAAARWRLTVETPEGTRLIDARFVMLCVGYYDYDAGHLPDWEGAERFAGTFVHPQDWPETLDWSGKRVVVIGSGATAVTLVPELARQAAHVTMLQRSPTHIAALPAVDRLANATRRTLGPRIAHRLTRWKNILFTIYTYNLAQRFPETVGRALRRAAARELPAGFDVETHLKPRYKPWDQRLCLAPDGDLFHAIRDGKADIVTDRLAHFDETGVVLAGGGRLDADIVVTATGLRLKILGGIAPAIDGQPVHLADTFSYKGAMYSGVPNCSVALGYINASWTLKCELVCEYVMRLLAHMDEQGLDYAVPRRPGAEMGRRTTFELSSGYLERARHLIPSQTDRGPWKQNQNYLKDLRLLRYGPVDDEMVFGRAGAPWRERANMPDVGAGPTVSAPAGAPPQAARGAVSAENSSLT
ncbi:MAG: NAD(P)/FAD-dependent oxidoreductase [Pseudomonadota bacterium]